MPKSKAINIPVNASAESKMVDAHVKSADNKHKQREAGVTREEKLLEKR